MDKEAYEIKKDGMTRAERRGTSVCWRNKLSDFLAIAKELGFRTGKL